jgi:osmotically-inducible protein OsmY
VRLDENIKKDVVDQLYWDDRVNAASVKVDVTEGAVTLSGHVPTYKARLSATEDTWKIDGVSEVQNQLVVFYKSTAKMPSDTELENRARQAVFWNAELDASNVKIKVEEGVATLSGSVDFYWKKWEVEKVVSHIYGITAINNHLTIVTTENQTDKEIAKHIEEALKRNIYVNLEDVIVKVEDGLVTLTGVVDSGFVYSQAEEMAAFTSGVKDVTNKIRVRLNENGQN